MKQGIARRYMERGREREEQRNYQNAEILVKHLKGKRREKAFT